MLPKRLSSKKENQLTGQQLELTDNLSSQQKIKKKRNTLILGLALTIGLSLFFSLYRFSRQLSLNLDISPPSFSLPSLKLSRSSKLDLKKPIFSILQKPDLWQIYVTTLHPPVYSWSHLSNPSNVNSAVSALSSQSPNLNSIVSPSLPQGIVIQDDLDSTQDKLITYQVLISVPGHQIYIHIKGPDQTLIADLVEIIYWQVIKHVNSF